jgi:hypothetical protein
LDIMIDLETLSTRTNAAIIQIGARAFSLTNEQPPINHHPADFLFRYNINVTLDLIAGAHMDPKTADWWAGQPLEARERLVDVAPVPPRWACERFASWYTHLGAQRIWSHGAAADLPWLTALFERHGVKVPWHYRAIRDTRTLYACAEELGWVQPERTEPAHDALLDCTAQIVQVQAAWDVVRKAIR